MSTEACTCTHMLDKMRCSAFHDKRGSPEARVMAGATGVEEGATWDDLRPFFRSRTGRDVVDGE